MNEHLVKFLEESRRAEILTVHAETVPEMKKEGNPYFGKIKKVAKINGMMNFHYSNAVRTRLLRLGFDPDEFKLGDTWHRPATMARASAISLHANLKKRNEERKKYLKLMVLKRGQYKYVMGKKEIPKQQIEPFIPKKKPNKWGVPVVTIDLNNVKGLRVRGKTYTFLNEPANTSREAID